MIASPADALSAVTRLVEQGGRPTSLVPRRIPTFIAMVD